MFLSGDKVKIKPECLAAPGQALRWLHALSDPSQTFVVDHLGYRLGFVVLRTPIRGNRHALHSVSEECLERSGT